METTTIIYFSLAVLATTGIIYGVIFIYKIIFVLFQKKHRYQQTKDIRFLQVRIPKNAVARSSDIEATDHTQSMKTNIEIMNQVYKNFYAIFEDDKKHKILGNNYISMEVLVEKEQIKFII